MDGEVAKFGCAASPECQLFLQVPVDSRVDPKPKVMVSIQSESSL